MRSGGGRELVQRIVYCRQRHGNVRGTGLFMQVFRSQVAVAFGKQQVCKRDALTGGPQVRVPKPHSGSGGDFK